MAIANTGALALSTIQTEFGGSDPISLSEYYANGTYVPAGTSGVNGAVPTSGTISISNFYGTSDVVISVTNQTVNAGEAFPGTATAGYRISHTGYVYELINGTPTSLEQWCTPTSASSGYEARATIITGSFFSGTAGTWFDLAPSNVVDWTVQETVYLQTTTCEFTLDIRTKTGNTIVDSATITIAATVI
jgi:hypothetical protein